MILHINILTYHYIRRSVLFSAAVPPEIVVPRLVVNTGETYVAQMACSVQAYPKVKVTWEKEILNENGPQTSIPVVTDGPNSRYDVSRQSSTHHPVQGSVNSTAMPVGPTFVLKVKQVQGPQDFGRYRCRAENRVGVAYSDYITLTGTIYTLFCMIYLTRPSLYIYSVDVIPSPPCGKTSVVYS